MLLARRLVENGCTFVTAVYSGWDHHWDLEAGMNSYLPKVDDAVASLLTDLDDRGLLERTLVVMCGEFSRTPKMNDGGNGGKPRSMGTPGRDHWGNSMFCFLARRRAQGRPARRQHRSAAASIPRTARLLPPTSTPRSTT